MFSTGTLYNEEDEKFSAQLSIFFHLKTFSFPTNDFDKIKDKINPFLIRLRVDLSPLILEVIFLKVKLPSALNEFYKNFLENEEIQSSVDPKTPFPQIGKISEICDFSLNSVDLCFKKHCTNPIFLKKLQRKQVGHYSC